MSDEKSIVSVKRPAGTGRAPARSRSEQVLTHLRSNIVKGHWPVGTRIPTEPELMAELGVGRSAVREGVQALVSMGILEPQVSRGTFVRSITPVGAVLTDFYAAFDLQELIDFRRAIEVQAARDAALRRSEADLQALTDSLAAARARAAEAERTGTDGPMGLAPGSFHALVFTASGNRLYDALYGGVMAVLMDAQRAGRLRFGMTSAEHGEGHEAILRAIESGDADAAAEAMGLHIDDDLVVSDPMA